MDEKNTYLAEQYNLYRDDLIRHCIRMVNYDSRYAPFIEDWVQEAFVKAFVHYHKFIECNNPMGWLTKCCNNKILTVLRTRKNNVARVGSMVSFENSAEIPDSVDYILNLINKMQSSDALNKLYANLTQNERRIYEDHYLHGYTMVQTANNNNLSLSAVKNTVGRIRKKAKDVNFMLFILLLIEYILELRHYIK